MNIDSDMQGVLDQFMKFNAPKIETLTPQNARNKSDTEKRRRRNGGKQRDYQNDERGDAGFARAGRTHRTHFASD